MENLFDIFRKRITVGGEEFLCRLVGMDVVEWQSSASRWGLADKNHLDAYEKRHFRGNKIPAQPIVALGGVERGDGYWLDAPFIGINNMAPGVFPGGVRTRGKALVNHWDNSVAVLEVKPKIQ